MRVVSHASGRPVDPFAYPNSPWRNADTAVLPQYTRALRWMRLLQGRAVSLDFWAQSFRARVPRFGGIVTTTAAAVGAAVGAATGSVDSAVAAASVSAAASGLCECVRSAVDHKLDMRRNPLFLLWQLGSEKGSRFKGARPFGFEIQSRSAAPIAQGEDGYFHSLAPPAAGVGFLAVRA